MNNKSNLLMNIIFILDILAYLYNKDDRSKSRLYNDEELRRDKNN